MMFVFGGCSESEHGVDPNDGKIAVSFSLPAIGVESSAGSASVASLDTRAGKPVPFDENVTVRIVAYKRTGPLADLSSDSYVDEATYIAVKEGSQIVLKPCTMSFDADTGRIDPSGIKTEGASPLRLMAGTYDFYAITPALALEKDATDGSTLAVPAKVSVHHGDDFASSLTGEVEVLSDGSVRQPDPANVGSKKTQTGGKVELIILDRKCSRIEFNVVRNTETAFDKLEIVSAKMTKMTKSPIVLSTILDDIYDKGASAGGSYVADNSAGFDFPTSAFTKNPDKETGMDTDFPYKWLVASPILPKKEDKYGITIGIRLGNDAGTAQEAELRTTDDKIGALAFLPDTRYTFWLKLKGNGIQLVLTIGNWESVDSWEDPDGIGGYPLTYVIIGTWDNVIEWTDDTDIGGFLRPEFTDGKWDWVPNQSWDSDLGVYIEELTASGIVDWDTSGWTNTDKNIGE